MSVIRFTFPCDIIPINSRTIEINIDNEPLPDLVGFSLKLFRDSSGLSDDELIDLQADLMEHIDAKLTERAIFSNVKSKVIKGTRSDPQFERDINDGAPMVPPPPYFPSYKSP